MHVVLKRNTYSIGAMGARFILEIESKDMFSPKKANNLKRIFRLSPLFLEVNFSKMILGNLRYLLKNKGNQRKYLILLSNGNKDKLNDSITELANKLAKVIETLERMESQQAVSKTVNDSMHKRLVDLEKQCRRNAQYSR